MTRNVTISNPPLLFMRILRVIGIKYAQSIVSKRKLIFQKYSLPLRLLGCTQVYPSDFKKGTHLCRQ